MPDAKRRTTLTLPVSVLEEAERMAKERHLTVSAVVSELLASSMQERRSRKSGLDVLKLYQKCFGGLTEEEQMIVDGVILEPVDD